VTVIVEYFLVLS